MSRYSIKIWVVASLASLWIMMLTDIIYCVDYNFVKTYTLFAERGMGRVHSFLSSALYIVSRLFALLTPLFFIILLVIASFRFSRKVKPLKYILIRIMWIAILSFFTCLSPVRLYELFPVYPIGSIFKFTICLFVYPLLNEMFRETDQWLLGKIRYYTAYSNRIILKWWLGMVALQGVLQYLSRCCWLFDYVSLVERIIILIVSLLCVILTHKIVIQYYRKDRLLTHMEAYE